MPVNQYEHIIQIKIRFDSKNKQHSKNNTFESFYSLDYLFHFNDHFFENYLITTFTQYIITI